MRQIAIVGMPGQKANVAVEDALKPPSTELDERCLSCQLFT
jgi:hypothetical protein